MGSPQGPRLERLSLFLIQQPQPSLQPQPQLLPQPLPQPQKMMRIRMSQRRLLPLPLLLQNMVRSFLRAKDSLLRQPAHGFGMPVFFSDDPAMRRLIVGDLFYAAREAGVPQVSLYRPFRRTKNV